MTTAVVFNSNLSITFEEVGKVVGISVRTGGASVLVIETTTSEFGPLHRGIP
jgi:hypothetical protein